jgi:general L-amino acid transport system permease protein
MTEVAAPRVRTPPWRDVRAQRVAGQIAFVVVAVLVAREAFLNLEFGVERQAQDLSFGFLRSRAGFGIKEGITYSPNDTVLRAFVVGIANTIRVALAGIVLASILGLIVGVARLSSNWLVRRAALVYVEAFRNTPVLIQIIFWWSAVFLALPAISRSVSIFGLVLVSNRAAAIPWLRPTEGAGVWAITVLAGSVAAVIVWVWRTRVNERTGEPHHRVLWAGGLFLAVALAGFAGTGPLVADVPEALERGYRGGFQLTPEFAALLMGLVFYTAAFIAEIVRGSIQAVERGQKEAAEALGLSRFQQLRFVVLPQALRIAIPPINSQYLNLMKNSSLAIAIGYPEIASVSNTIINQKAHETQVLFLMMGTYLAISLAISLVMNVVNRAVTVEQEHR